MARKVEDIQRMIFELASELPPEALQEVADGLAGAVAQAEDIEEAWGAEIASRLADLDDPTQWIDGDEDTRLVNLQIQELRGARPRP